MLRPRGFEATVVDEDARVRRWEHSRVVDGGSERVVARIVDRGAGCSLDLLLGFTLDVIERRLRPLERLCGRPLRGELFMSETTYSCGLRELYAKWPAVFADEDALSGALAALGRYLEREGLDMLSAMREPSMLSERLRERRQASKSCAANVALLDVYAAVHAGEAPGPVIEQRRELLEVRRASLNQWYGARDDAWRRAFEFAVTRLDEPDGEVVAREFEERELVRELDRLAYWSLVRHPKFGLARVTNITGRGDASTVEVELLDTSKKKTFVARVLLPAP